MRECWSDDKDERPEFSKIVQFFQEQNVCSVGTPFMVLINGKILLQIVMKMIKLKQVDAMV